MIVYVVTARTEANEYYTFVYSYKPKSKEILIKVAEAEGIDEDQKDYLDLTEITIKKTTVFEK